MKNFLYFLVFLFFVVHLATREEDRGKDEYLQSEGLDPSTLVDKIVYKSLYDGTNTLMVGDTLKINYIKSLGTFLVRYRDDHQYLGAFHREDLEKLLEYSIYKYPMDEFDDPVTYFEELIEENIKN